MLQSMQRTARSLAGVLTLVVLALLPASASAQAQTADLVFLNGTVYTADAARPQAQAVAVRDGRIVFVGSTREARAMAGTSTRVVDLEGKAMIPGMIDSHGHVTSLGAALQNVDLVGTRSFEEIVERMTARAAEAPGSGWLQGRGWDQNEWTDTRFPNHAILTAAVPDRPVALGRVDGHALIVNQAALQAAGIDRSTPDPAGGRILRDANGDATGVLIDNAMGLVYSVIPASTPAEIREGIMLAQADLNRLGLTSTGDAGVGRRATEVFEQMARDDELTFRNNIMVAAGGGLDHYLQMGPRFNIGGKGRLNVAAIKVSIDGALGSRGAALLEPYSDEDGHTGLLLVEPDTLRRIADDAARTGFQLNVHAIGDRGNRIVLDVFEEALGRAGVADHRWRIEHAQILHRFDIPRFAELGVIPSMQAIHQASDMAWVPNRIGYSRLFGTYAWRSLIESGVVIAGGSDFPVESPDPLLSFHAAVTRQNSDNWPSGGWFPEQKMTRQEALLHLTAWGAYAAFQEDEIGSITEGKWADMVILSEDIMTVPDERILDAQVLMTVVGGDVVYDARAANRPISEQGAG